MLLRERRRRERDRLRRARAVHLGRAHDEGEPCFKKLDVRVRAPLERWIKHYANEGPENLPREYLKTEQRLTERGVTVLILAFREATTRLYGGQVPEQALFLVTEIVEKKTRKADPAALRRAARALVDYYLSHAKGTKR